ncbi:unnamed protein product [Adineta ricciae]|uniref:NHL repeat containing protein-like protein n=1 Tax=Adineta ricciae TaxID=249248 RepID=A0A815JN59_ADIRI|nr:unnamed protein product [Adineta ricciae]CAF1590366.1 unnamed protein product [Adineta ricciae]
MFQAYILFSVISFANCILLGKIDNFVIIGAADETILNITRNQCICEMIQSNYSTSAFNYYSNNQTCQLFYSNITFIYVQYQLNTLILFVNQSNLAIQLVRSIARPVVCPSAVWNPNGTTVAGSANGDGGSSSSQLNNPFDIAVDSALSVYVADYSNYRVMKCINGSVNGTVVGPQLGFGIGPDTQHLHTATALYLDSTESNLYIADTHNCRILKWNIVSNNVTVVVGGSGCGSSLNTFYWSFGNIYVSDYNNNRILKFPPNSNSSTLGVIVAGTGTSGSASNQLNTPAGIYVDERDNDTLYVADRLNNRVMKYRTNETNGTVVAGGNGLGTSFNQLYYPRYVFVDSFGTVYVSDTANHRIMKWVKDARNGTLVVGVTGLTGTTPSRLNNPYGIRLDKSGNLYVADYTNDRVQRFTIDNSSC